MSSLVLESTAAPKMHFSLVERHLPISPAARCQEWFLCDYSHIVHIQFCPFCSVRKNWSEWKLYYLSLSLFLQVVRNKNIEISVSMVSGQEIPGVCRGTTEMVAAPYLNALVYHL